MLSNSCFNFVQPAFKQEEVSLQLTEIVVTITPQRLGLVHCNLVDLGLVCALQKLHFEQSVFGLFDSIASLLSECLKFQSQVVDVIVDFLPEFAK